MVLICHLRGSNWVEWRQLQDTDQTWSAKAFFAITRPGLEWVVVFFVLSGYLVGGSIIRKIAEHRFDLPQFALDRASRIWVPLLPALIFSFVVAAACGIDAPLGDLAGNMLGLQGVIVPIYAHNEPLWSLSYEIWFYVIAGAFAIAVSGKPWARLGAAATLAVSLVIFTKLSPWLLACWAIGAYSAFAESKSAPMIGALSGLSLALVGAGLSQLQSGSMIMGLHDISSLLPSRNIALVFESIGVALVVGSMVRIRPSGRIVASIEGGGPRLVAFSYTLYLTHYPTLSLWEHFGPAKYTSLVAESFFLFGLKLGSCLALALGFYYLFESRTHAVRQWIRQLLDNGSDKTA